MFALRDLGYGTLFQQLVACIISIRTTDEVSLPTALALLARFDVFAGSVDAAVPRARLEVAMRTRGGKKGAD